MPKNSDIAGFIIAQIEIENNTLFGHIITINVPPTYRRKGVEAKCSRKSKTSSNKKA